MEAKEKCMPPLVVGCGKILYIGREEGVTAREKGFVGVWPLVRILLSPCQPSPPHTEVI